MSFIGGQLFAVDSAGNFYSVNEGNATASLIATLARDDFDSTAPNVPVSFTGLTTGPRYVEGSTYASMLFATDSSGRLYAFNTAGTPQSVFVDGQSVIDTGRDSAEGLAFSTLDVNLWHVNSNTTQDAVNAMGGHSGSSSLYFGFQTVGTTPGQWDNTVYNPRSPANFATSDGNVTHTYDFPGGAHGVIESNTFDLSGYNAADKPVLYFNYYLDTEKQDGGDMRDAFRVYIANEDGNWSLIATNNNGGGEFVTDDGSNGQILFDVGDTGTRAGDNTGPAPNVWRQARILLDAYAGQSDLRLRFEFDSSGNSRVGDGASTGDELRMIDGNKLRDGQTFVISDTDGTQVTFEFDLGYTLVAPTGKDLVDGNSFTLNATTYTFRNSPALATEIQIDPNDSANEVMDKIRARLNATGFFTASGLRDGHRLNIPTVLTASASGLPGTFLEGTPGISGLSDVELDVTAAMPAWDSNNNFADDVKSVVRVGIAEQFNVAGRKPSDIGNLAATSLIKDAREIVRVIGRDSAGNARSVAD
ncbi:MAG: hypothetical protein KDA55_05955, partial [Planctomycetales bacterium]|nr:hypothetical protein [Planctomycetales bacterium]